jgi:tetratricopeptide (TPR) repeat protein
VGVQSARVRGKNHQAYLWPYSRADLRVWLANAYDRAGNLPDALEAYQKAEALEPHNAEIFYERALAYRNHNRFTEAARDFRRAYELDPSRENALELARQMAVAPYQATPDADDTRSPKTALEAELEDAGENHAAEIAVWNRALARSPDNAVYWNRRGWAQWQHGDLRAALSDFEQAIHLQPDFLQARV